MTTDHQRRMWTGITAHLDPADRAMVLRLAGVENDMTKVTWKPQTVREWLESLRLRDSDDADWAHLLMRGLEDAPDDGDYYDDLLEEKL